MYIVHVTKVMNFIYQIGGLVTGELAFGVFSVVAIALILFILYMIFRPNKYKVGRK